MARFSTVTVVVLLVTSCTVGPPGSGLPADTDATTLIETFAPCGRRGEFDVEPAEHLVETAGRWLGVTRIIDRPDGAWEGSEQVELEVVPFTGSEPATESVLMWHEHADALGWAVASGAEPWVVMPPPDYPTIDGLIAFTLIVPDHTGPFFAGPCAFYYRQGPLEEMLGDRSEETLRAMVGKTGNELAEVLGVTTSTAPLAPVDPDLQVLDPPGTALLNTLRTATVQYLLDVPLGSDYLICSKIAVGWNDCFVPDAKSASLGYAMGEYLDDTGVLEVWLLDRFASPVDRIQFLGTIRVPEELADLDRVAMRVELEVASLERPVVTLVEAIPGDQFDYTDPEWTSFDRQPPGTATTGAP